AQRQALLLHGPTATQVEDIIRTRTLLGSIAVRGPGATALDGGADKLVVQSLAADRGQHVSAGDTLAVLVDHATLLIEGDAFEQDITAITEAATADQPITAVLDAPGVAGRHVEGLHIAYVADRVAAESRTLRFYVTLPNEAGPQPRADGMNHLLTWRYKPGQRMQLQVPVEEWTERIVLPAQAVAQDGVENYVFRANGDHFDREPVHVEHRDPQWVVIANDGTLFPGDRVAMSAAQQLQLAIKNKSGGGVDPHAGHNH
ncbi:MAG: efflux RND transporter periplasmic adaptor subunit, partial [Pirellulales bacterium]